MDEEKIGDIVYTVKKNETLWEIAKKYYGDGSRYVEIAKNNKINNPDLIKEGDKLILSLKISDIIEPIHEWEYINEVSGTRSYGKSYIQSIINEKDKAIEYLQQEINQKNKIIEEIKEYIPILRKISSYDKDEYLDNLEEIIEKEVKNK